jgi:hypothetical protein
MSSLKKFFTFKRDPNENSSEKEKTIILDDYLDSEFINALYFRDEQIRDSYISSIKEVLNALLESGEISRVAVSEYMTNNETNIPFLIDAIKLDNYNGKFKIERYYTALAICRHNLL